MSTACETTRNAISKPSGTTATQRTRQRNKHLTTLTLLTLAVLTVLTQLPGKSTAASLNVPKLSTSPATIPARSVLASVSADNALSNSPPAVLQQLADSTTSSHRGRRKRLHKRHSGSTRLIQLAGMPDEQKSLEWLNACGGQQVGPPNMEPASSGQVTKEWSLLKRSLRSEKLMFHKLRSIDIDNMKLWEKHNPKYKFLPLLNDTNKIHLHRWHHAMQKFVASFVELGVKQYRWEQNKNQHPTALLHEFNLLLLSAKRVLCDVESALKLTTPQAKLPTITSEEMQKVLNFEFNGGTGLSGRGQLDLIFAKHRYFLYVRRMLKTLRYQLKAHKGVAGAPAKLLMHSNESSPQWAAISQDYSASSSESNEYSLGA